MRPCSGGKQRSRSNSPHRREKCCECPEDTLPHYKEDCPPKWCPPACEDKGLCGHEICVKYKPAVVKLTTEFHFTTNVEDLDNLGRRPTDLQTVYTRGNGFFINKHVIVAPASLVLAPPDHSTVYNRWPQASNIILSGSTIDGAAGTKTWPIFNGNTMTKGNRFFVDVQDVNGSKHSYTYQADLIGVSGVGDIALLWIDMSRPWNTVIPCIKNCHPHFRFGCSRKSHCGEKAFLIGDAFTRIMRSPILSPNPNATPVPLLANGGLPFGGFTDTWVNFQGNSGQLVIETTIADNRYIDHRGYAQQELVAVNANVFSENVGLPIIDQFGHVIGMQTLSTTGMVQLLNLEDIVPDNSTIAPVAPATEPTLRGQLAKQNGDGMVAGPSQFFMLHVIKTLLAPGSPCNAPFLDQVDDILGNYWRFTQGYLGLAWEVFDGSMYLSYRDRQTGVRTDFQSSNELVIKEIIGLRVNALVDDDITTPSASLTDAHLDVFLPTFNVTVTAGDVTNGPNNNPLNGPSIPVKDKVYRNDIITHADECPLGDINKQIPISLVLFRKAPEIDKVKLCVRSSSHPNNVGAPSAEGYVGVFVKTPTVQKMPKFYDYPWYKYSAFPYQELSAFQQWYPLFNGVWPNASNQVAGATPPPLFITQFLGPTLPVI